MSQESLEKLGVTPERQRLMQRVGMRYLSRTTLHSDTRLRCIDQICVSSVESTFGSHPLPSMLHSYLSIPIKEDSSIDAQYLTNFR